MQKHLKNLFFIEVFSSLFSKRILSNFFTRSKIFFVLFVSINTINLVEAQTTTASNTEENIVKQEKTKTNSVPPQRMLSLKASFDQAYENNKELIAAKYNLPIAKAGIQIAGAIPNPQFGLQEEILTAGKRSKKLNLARANYTLAELQVAATLFDIHNRVRRAYAELAAAEAYIHLIDAQKTVALELASISEKRYQAGSVPKVEVLQAQLGALQFDTQHNQAKTRLEQATMALSLLIGEIPQKIEVIDVDDNGIFKLSAQHTDLVPSPEQSLPALEHLLPISCQERPDLKVAIQQAFADRRALTLAKTQRVPNLSIDCGYQFTTFKPIQPYNLTSARVPNSPGCYLNVSAEMPIFYQYQGEIKQAKETWLQDFAQTDQIKSQMATDIVTSYESVVVSRANIAKFQKQLIPAALQVARLAHKRYEVGKGDLASAILAKQQYQQILSSYFDAVVSYQNAWANLEKAMGVSLRL
jgi:cobalt-zinc-cadmium efflux system outer membrane protein